MQSVKSAIIAAIVAALVASGGTYAATGLISGKQIRDHSIPASKLTARAVASLRGQAGAQGAVGPQGPEGPQGLAAPFSLSSIKLCVAPTTTVRVVSDATPCHPGETQYLVALAAP